MLSRCNSKWSLDSASASVLELCIFRPLCTDVSLVSLEFISLTGGGALLYGH